MMDNEIATQANTIVNHYFAGERLEMLLIFTGSAFLSAVAVWLWATTRVGFSASFAITVVAASLLLSATATSLLVRDKGIETNITKNIQTERKYEVLNAEQDRVAVIISKYQYYSFGAGVIAVLAVLALMLSKQGWAHGLAAGLLLLVVAQVIIDHFSERRAVSYYQAIDQLDTKSPAGDSQYGWADNSSLL